MVRALKTKMDNFCMVDSLVQTNEKKNLNKDGCLYNFDGMSSSVKDLYLSQVNKKFPTVSGISLQNGQFMPPS